MTDKRTFSETSNCNNPFAIFSSVLRTESSFCSIFFLFSVLRFDGATKEWLEFVVNNRRGKGKNSYDLIMGPVANDQLYATIRLYEQGVVTADAAIEMLKTHKLFNQLSFHTVKVIPLLKFTESIEV